MCPPDQTSDKPDDGASTGTADGNTEAAQEQNHVVGPLTDDELQAGGMDRVVAFIRTKRSKDALRKEKQRNKQEGSGKRQINLVVPDDDRSRASMRGAAIAIEDEVAHRALELLLVNEATSRVREAMELAAANPEFVFFGRNAATQRSLCARLARLLLRIRKIRQTENTP